MNADDLPTPDENVATVRPASLQERFEDDSGATLLDVRMESDYEEWHIDGDAVESINVPYFEFLDGAVDEDVLDRIPTDRRITVLCAKGGASEYVAASLATHGYDVEHLEDGMNGWARVYEAVEVTDYDGAGTLIQYQRPSSGCLTYLLVEGGEAAVVDPLRAFTDQYLEDADDLGVEVTYALDTHVHADHLSGVRDLQSSGVEGVVPEPAVDRGISYADEVTVLADGDTVTVGDATVEAVHTPGHTTGMTSYLLDGSVLATGDGLFVESVARPDLEAGADGARAAARALYESLQDRVLALPDETLVGGAHYSDAAEPAPDGSYTARLGTLRGEIDALTVEEDVFVDRVLADMPPRPANFETIIETNLGRTAVDDEAAFSLELGPNNCAASRTSLAGD